VASQTRRSRDHGNLTRNHDQGESRATTQDERRDGRNAIMDRETDASSRRQLEFAAAKSMYDAEYDREKTEQNIRQDEPRELKCHHHHRSLKRTWRRRRY